MRYLKVLGLIVSIAQSVAWADCQTEYSQAVTLLQSTQSDVAKEKHPNPDAFSTQFQGIVEKMQTEKCRTELQKLVQYIQDEQKKLPADTEKTHKPVPVID